jgi:hypothetical protein
MGRAVPPIPFLPEAADPPPWFRVTPNRGVPVVLFRLVCTDVLAVPADVVALGLLPERVPAFGFVDVFVFAVTGTFFDRFMVMLRPDRGADPFAFVLGAVAVEPGLGLVIRSMTGRDRCGWDRHNRYQSDDDQDLLISISSPRRTRGCAFQAFGRPDAHPQMTFVIDPRDGCPDRAG